MLPEAGAFELIFLAMVALIVVGPKDLPVLLRKVGQFTAKMRGLAAEFRSSFDEMARQSELDELRKEVDALRTGQFAAHAVPDLDHHVGEINASLHAPTPTSTPALPPPAAQPELALEGPEAEPLLPFDAPVQPSAKVHALADEPRA